MKCTTYTCTHTRARFTFSLSLSLLIASTLFHFTLFVPAYVLAKKRNKFCVMREKADQEKNFFLSFFCLRSLTDEPSRFALSRFAPDLFCIPHCEAEGAMLAISLAGSSQWKKKKTKERRKEKTKSVQKKRSRKG